MAPWLRSPPLLPAHPGVRCGEGGLRGFTTGVHTNAFTRRRVVYARTGVIPESGTAFGKKKIGL